MRASDPVRRPRPALATETYAGVGGTTDRVLLVPGLGVASYLRPAARALAAAGWDATLVHPPGWPDAPGAVGARPPASMAALGRVIGEELLARAAGEPVVVVGQSIGTQIAAHAAATAGRGVRLLVLQGPTVDPAYRSRRALAWRWVRNAPHERVSLGLGQVPEWCRVGVPTLYRWLSAAVDDRLEETLDRVQCPVLIVMGADDRMARRAWASTLTPWPVAVLAGGHTALDRDPVGFADLLTAAAGSLR